MHRPEGPALGWERQGPHKGKQNRDDLRQPSPQTMKTGTHTGPGRTHGPQSAGRPRLAGMSRVWGAQLLTAAWCWGLTVLSDAHLQKALLCLHPLAYLISAVYEALQKNEENVRTNALLRSWAQHAVLLRRLPRSTLPAA